MIQMQVDYRSKILNRGRHDIQFYNVLKHQYIIPEGPDKDLEF